MRRCSLRRWSQGVTLKRLDVGFDKFIQMTIKHDQALQVTLTFRLTVSQQENKAGGNLKGQVRFTAKQIDGFKYEMIMIPDT